MDELMFYHTGQPFRLESGEQLPGLTIAYHTYGTLNERRDNVVWICHHLTANSDVASWWPGMIGPGAVINPDQHFIVCANILGSCYGSTGPLSQHPATGRPYYQDFPFITIRDMVGAHILLRRHLGIESIYLLVGGSMGGYQALEWACLEKDRIRRLFLLATSPAETAWGIAAHTAQRLAIEADGTWLQPSPLAGSQGLKAARAVAMLLYRNYQIMVRNQTDTDVSKLDHFRASSYINYQGDKLVKRFNAYSYWILSKAMDTHNLARNRAESPEAVLRGMHTPTLLIGIHNDLLCPLQEQQRMASNMPNATLVAIDSEYGHDGFMVESAKITPVLRNWLA
ncbi:MAG TPA: homoserine O-acetyltransferase [Chitinophagaceae bacterium]|nr:homoserine O-acetyltransferase [Chitinophagaceae bacterium]